jgi:hypothetical protein
MADETKQTQAQLDLQVQINKVLQDRQAILKAQEKALSSQVQLAVDMCKALKCEELDKVEERLKTTREAMAAAAEEAARLGGGLEDIGSKGDQAGKKATGALGGLTKHLTSGKLAAAGFGLGVLRFGGIFVQTFKNILAMAGGLVMTLGKVGFSILTLPFKLLGGLFNLAQSQGGGGPSPIRVELENIRKEMGGLAQGAGAAAASALPQFRAQLSNLAGTGLSVRRVFGRGREGLAKAMAYNLELMKALGPAVGNFSGIIKKSAVELAMYRKGLGLTAEQQAQMMKQAQAVGRDPVDAQREFASMAINMGEQFGMSASAIGKDMAEMKSDFASFGTLSVRELGQASVYARKLGIEIKALQGLVGQFDDFETAAQNAAKLSQAFGMNIDAMKMMNAQNPAERLSMLQKAFRETGRSVEQMSRQELKLLAQQSGLTEEAAKLAFSQRGLSMSYDQVQKAGAKSEKKQLTQAEAMSKLADSIERVFGSGGGSQFKGFFDAFTQGFARGIMKSQEFIKLFRNIRQSLKAVYWGAVEIGRQFVKLFPGIKEMAKGLGDIFNPQRFRNLMREFTGVFTRFFRDLRTDPKAGVETFVKNFKDVIEKFFGRSGSGAKTFIEGGKAFLQALGGIAMAVGPMLLEALSNGINAVADFLADPPEIPGAVKEMGIKLWESLVRLFDVLVDRLGPPIIRMFKNLWERVSPYIEQAAAWALKAALTKALLTSIAGALGGAVVGALVTGVKKLFGIIPKPPPGGGGGPTSAADAAKKAIPMLAAIGAILAAGAGLMAVYKATGMKPEDALAIGALVVALGTAGAMLSATIKMVPDKAPLSKFVVLAGIMTAAGGAAAATMLMLKGVEAAGGIPSKEAVLSFTGVILTLAAASIPLIVAAAVIGSMGGLAGKALIGMGILGVFMVALGYAGAHITELLSKSTPDPTGVATLMEAISSIMYATMLMLPAALALGLMLFAAPFGTAGVAAIAAGFEVLSDLATGLVSSLIPTIKELAAIRIPRPGQFKTVTGALVDIIRAISLFTGALGALAFFLRPAKGSSETFEGNIEKFTKLVDTILNSGINQTIEKLVSLTKSTDITDKGVAAVGAIAKMFSGVGAMMVALSPSSEAMKSVTAAATTWGGDEVGLMEQINKGMAAARTSLTALLPTITGTVEDIVEATTGIPPEAANTAPLISAISTLFGAAASVMKALSPSDAAWKAVSDVAGESMLAGGAVGIEMAQAVTKQIEAIAAGAKEIFEALGEQIPKMIGPIISHLEPVMRSLQDVDPEAMKSLTSLLTGAFGVIGNLAGSVSSLARDTLRTVPKGGDASAALEGVKGLMEQMGETLSGMAAPMSQFANTIIEMARGLGDTRGLKSKIDIISSTFAALGQITGVLKEMGGHMRKAKKEGEDPVYVSGPKHMLETLRRFTREGADAYQLFGGEDPVIGQFIRLISGIKVAPGLKSKTDSVKSVFESLSTVITAISAAGGASFMDANISNISVKLEKIISADFFTKMKDLSTQLSGRVPDITEKVTAISKNFESLHTALTSSKLGDIDTIVELGEALRGERTLTVKHENINMNLQVTVNVSARQIADAVIEVNNIGGRENNRITTSNPSA